MSRTALGPAGLLLLAGLLVGATGLALRSRSRAAAEH